MLPLSLDAPLSVALASSRWRPTRTRSSGPTSRSGSIARSTRPIQARAARPRSSSRSSRLAQATPLLELAFADPDVEVRLAAADAAIRLRWTPATDAVLPWLGDREPRLRIKACEVARAMPSPRAVPALARALGDSDPAVRAAAAEALGEQASAEAVAPLLGKLDDPLPPVRIQVVRALAHLRDARAVVPLVGKVQDSVPEVRREVARALGDLGDARASQALVLQLRDNISEVRLEALRSLGRLRADDAVDAIAPLAAEHTPAVRQTALEALGRIASPESIQVLVGMLGQTDDGTGSLEHTPVRDALVSAGPAAIAQVAAVLREPTVSTTTATSASWVLGELVRRPPRSPPPSGGATSTWWRPSSRRCGAACFRPRPRCARSDASGIRSAVPVVLEFALDASPQVRQEALDAAARLLDPQKPDGRVVEPLVAALRDPRLQSVERARVATLLGRTGAARSAAPLVSLAAAKDRTLRLAAIDALGVLGSATDPATSALRDDVLVPLVSDTDAELRLHAALALASAGGAKAEGALFAKLGASEETDRSAVLTALAGVLSRSATKDTIKRLDHELELSAGADRDAVLVAMARAKTPDAAAPLARIAKSEFAEDRRAVATLLPARPRAEAAPLATTLVGDGDASVRAQAAWSLGTLGGTSDAPALLKLAQGGDMDSSIDATAALGRIAARAHAKALASQWLCPLLDHAHPYVRANALVGLALADARCKDAAKVRRVLQTDPNDIVRAAAARALRTTGAEPDDVRALEGCAVTDRSGSVARVCRQAPSPTTTTAPLLVYVVADDAALPTAKSAYAIVLPDGLVHVGTTDRRGAVFDPVTPVGEVSLERPSATRVK